MEDANKTHGNSVAALTPHRISRPDYRKFDHGTSKNLRQLETEILRRSFGGKGYFGHDRIAIDVT